MKKGCILIPAYNEEKHIGRVIESARQFLPVIVVDDGSVDQTAALAESSGATVFLQNPNQGKGAALQRGFQEIMRCDYDYLITLDADGQHDTLEIPLFIEKFDQSGFDLIIGYRDFSKMPLIRRISNTIGRKMFSWAMRQPIIDNQSGYRLLSSRLFRILVDNPERGFEYEVEMIYQCLINGYRLGWVPIKTIYADETSHIKPFHHLIHFLRVVWTTRRRTAKKA